MGIKTPQSQKKVEGTTTAEHTKSRQYIIRLGHYSHISDYQRATPGYAVKATWNENYETQPLTIIIPQRGTMITTVRCNVCGEELDLKVNSLFSAKIRQVLLVIVFGLLSIPAPILIIVDLVFLVFLFLPIAPHNMASLVKRGNSTNKHKLFENKEV